jgi:ELWxxDGT repeat protein
MVADIGGSTSANPANLTNLNGKLYFSAYTSLYGSQLWQSNGTSSGTTMVADINGTSGANPANFVVMGTSLYFAAKGATMWRLTP